MTVGLAYRRALVVSVALLPRRRSPRAPISRRPPKQPSRQTRRRIRPRRRSTPCRGPRFRPGWGSRRRRRPSRRRRAAERLRSARRSAIRRSSFRIGGRFFGWEAIGIGEKPANPPPGYSGTPIHAPLLTTGKTPFWGGAGATLNVQYGTKYLTAYVAYYFRTNNETFQGYSNPQLGPGFGTAYLLITPDPIGTLRLQFRVGAFTEVYAGPGQWGWGIFGPMLAVRGYGETANGEWDLNRRWRLTLTQGFLVVPGVPEDFPRGDYNSWLETGVSSYVNHAHVGLVLDNQWTFKLHYATDHGTDDRNVPSHLPRHAAPGRADGHLYRRGALAGRPLGTVRGQRRALRLRARRLRSATASGGASTTRRAPTT